MAMTQTCQQIRNETLSLFYAGDTFSLGRRTSSHRTRRPLETASAFTNRFSDFFLLVPAYTVGSIELACETGTYWSDFTKELNVASAIYTAQQALKLVSNNSVGQFRFQLDRSKRLWPSPWGLDKTSVFEGAADLPSFKEKVSDMWRNSIRASTLNMHAVDARPDSWRNLLEIDDNRACECRAICDVRILL